MRCPSPAFRCPRDRSRCHVWFASAAARRVRPARILASRAQEAGAAASSTPDERRRPLRKSPRKASRSIVTSLTSTCSPWKPVSGQATRARPEGFAGPQSAARPCRPRRIRRRVRRTRQQAPCRRRPRPRPPRDPARTDDRARGGRRPAPRAPCRQAVGAPGRCDAPVGNPRRVRAARRTRRRGEAWHCPEPRGERRRLGGATNAAIRGVARAAYGPRGNRSGGSRPPGKSAPGSGGRAWSEQC
jgi:hypothetical protein